MPAVLAIVGRPPRELARRQRIAWFVRELARQIAAVAEKLAALDSGPDARGGFLTAGDDDASTPAPAAPRDSPVL